MRRLRYLKRLKGLRFGAKETRLVTTKATERRQR
jgi:hypothetical protein